VIAVAVHELHEQFIKAHQAISLRGRALVAVAAHVEVRSVLRRSPELRTHGLDDVLVGSYARKVSIWPGKDVDVFGRLLKDSAATAEPDFVYALFVKALEPYAEQGRLTPQPRSLKVDFGPRNVPDESFIREAASEYKWTRGQVDSVLADRDRLAFGFSVDVVPAVTWDSHYGIPEVATEPSSGDRYRTGRWRRTNPVGLTDRTRVLNRRIRIDGKGAYVRVVKTVRQLKKHHLEDAKPSSLYYELLLHEGFEGGAITGDSWAEVTSSALDYSSRRLGNALDEPVSDPVLDEPYAPAPSVAELDRARQVFDEHARRARRAVRTTERCQAALEWRQVFGGNETNDHVFPLPDGCRGTGVAMGAAAANVAVGGTGERSFGAA
jgi:hypothetical protein